MNKVVSVVIPCYNVESYIEQCVDSVLKQSHQQIELICIDNNSSDRTWQVLCDLKQKHVQMIIDREMKPGANAARNKGLFLSHGEWVQFLDADDLLMPQKIEHQLSLLKDSPSQTVYIAASCLRRRVDGTEYNDNDIYTDQYAAAFINKSGNTCANLWNAAAIRNAGGWNENIKSSQEAELMMRLLLAGGHFIVDRTPLTIVREREYGQISTREPGQNVKRYIDVRLAFLEKFKQADPEHYKKYNGMFMDFLVVSVLILARYDEQQALDYYSKHIKGNWRSAHMFGLNSLKVAIIKLFGLKAYIKLVLSVKPSATASKKQK